MRDLYENSDFPNQVLIVASDRVSAFDHVLAPEIPGKGANLTKMTNWWFQQIDFPNHLATNTAVPEKFKDRAVIAKKLQMFPIECVVRGYLAGGGWQDYQQTGSISGVELPAGLQFGAKLPNPIFTPAFKAELGDHDENISFQRVEQLVGADVARSLKSASLEIFEFASKIADQAGLILADTKFEFGSDKGVLTLADEVLTPDSSRYWDFDLWSSGATDQSFDKQIVRNWLAANWNKQGSPPQLPDAVVNLTASKYEELASRLCTRG